VLALSVVRPVVAPAPGWLAGGDSASGRDGGRDARPSLSSSAPDGARTGPLELYQAEGCPYCRRVRAFCTDEGISVLLHNPRTAGTAVTGGTVTNPDRHEELVGHCEDQVPLLVDRARDEVVYGSDEVVASLDEHYARGGPGAAERVRGTVAGAAASCPRRAYGEA
jgi:hypothetical protein